MSTRDEVGTNEMIELRNDAKWTLQQIADKFGISRERVRQRIGNTGQVHHEHTKEIVKNNIHLSNFDLAKLIGFSDPDSVSRLRNGERHAISGGAIKIGTEMEDYVSKILNKHNISHKLMPHHHPFDILLDNGLKVDVKTRNIGTANGYEVYTFPLRQDTRGRYADFFICVTMDTKDIFVIPASETLVKSQIIRINRLSDGTSKWHKYHNRFDLLK